MRLHQILGICATVTLTAVALASPAAAFDFSEANGFYLSEDEPDLSCFGEITFWVDYPDGSDLVFHSACNGYNAVRGDEVYFVDYQGYELYQDQFTLVEQTGTCDHGGLWDAFLKQDAQGALYLFHLSCIYPL